MFGAFAIAASNSGTVSPGDTQPSSPFARCHPRCPVWQPPNLAPMAMRSRSRSIFAFASDSLTRSFTPHQDVACLFASTTAFVRPDACRSDERYENHVGAAQHVADPGLQLVGGIGVERPVPVGLAPAERAALCPRRWSPRTRPHLAEGGTGLELAQCASSAFAQVSRSGVACSGTSTRMWAS